VQRLFKSLFACTATADQRSIDVKKTDSHRRMFAVCTTRFVRCSCVRQAT
jgi:hypothetical protein